MNLKEIREERGVKQLAVADHLGVTRATYAKYEENPARMPLGMAVRACEFLHVPITEVSFFAEER